MAKPTITWEWATAAGASKADPPTGKASSGFTSGDPLPSDWINSKWNNDYQIKDWLVRGITTGHTGIKAVMADTTGELSVSSALSDTGVSGAWSTGTSLVVGTDMVVNGTSTFVGNIGVQADLDMTDGGATGTLTTGGNVLREGALNTHTLYGTATHWGQEIFKAQVDFEGAADFQSATNVYMQGTNVNLTGANLTKPDTSDETHGQRLLKINLDNANLEDDAILFRSDDLTAKSNATWWELNRAITSSAKYYLPLTEFESGTVFRAFKVNYEIVPLDSIVISLVSVNYTDPTAAPTVHHTFTGSIGSATWALTTSYIPSDHTFDLDRNYFIQFSRQGAGTPAANFRIGSLGILYSR